jgi:hypothetical protein
MGLMVNFTWEERYSRGTYFPMYEFAKAKMETRGLDDLSVAVNADGTTTVSCRRKRFVE